MMIQNLPQRFLPSKFGRLVNEVTNCTQAPVELVTSVALAAASLAVQSGHRVQFKQGHIVPCSLFLLNISDSGERKSTVQKLLFKPYVDMECKSSADTACQMQEFVTDHKLWSKKLQLVEREMERLVDRVKNTEEVDSRYRAILSCEPKPPKAQKWIYSDTTREALLQGMSETGGSAGLIFDEFGQFSQGRLQKSIPLLNTLWTGEGERVDRKASESFIMQQSNLTMLLQAQPEVFQDYLIRHKANARGSGFLARVLMGFPLSTQGYRNIETTAEPTEILDWFFKRCQTLIGIEAQTVLIFSQEAESRWKSYANWCEYSMNTDSNFASIKDFLSKAPEHVARLAAVMHVINTERSHLIGEDSMHAAIQMIFWHMNQFMQIMSTVSKEAEMNRDLHELYTWIRNECMRNNGFIAVSQVAQYGPNRFRKKDRLNCLLDNLCMAGTIQLFSQGKKRFIRSCYA